MNSLVLINSEDAEFYLVLSHILQVDGFTTELAGSVEEALQVAAARQVRAIILDCQPRSASRAELCARLKQDSHTSSTLLVALIAPGAENQHIDLLKAGIDESFIRPAAPAKLLNYLRSKLAARPIDEGVESGKYLIYGDIEMSLDSHRVRRGGKELFLGPIEFKLLRHMLHNPGKVLSRDELIGAAWPDNVYVDGRTVDVHIGQLRRTLKMVSKSNVIRTVRSAGYALEDQGP